MRDKDGVPIVFPEDYGAVGDGATDCTKAFEKALQEAAAISGRVYVGGRERYLEERSEPLN